MLCRIVLLRFAAFVIAIAIALAVVVVLHPTFKKRNEL